HAERESVEARRSERREMKDEFVAVVEEAIAVDGLVVTDGEVARQPCGGPGGGSIDGDRLDPMNDVLELQVLTRGLRHIERRPGIARLAADIEKQRTVWAEYSAGLADPGSGPVEIVGRRQRIAVAAVLNAKSVRR